MEGIEHDGSGWEVIGVVCEVIEQTFTELQCRAHNLFIAEYHS